MHLVPYVLFLIAVLPCVPVRLSAQSNTSLFNFSAGSGYVVPNHPDFPGVKNPAFVASAGYFRHLDGYKSWHRFYNFPYMGIDITGGSIGNDEVLGHFAGAMAQLRFDKTIGKNFFRSVKLSLGGSWFSKPYNETHNNDNVAIGSAVTFLASAEAGVGYRINNHLSSFVSLGILHASNSHYKLPNVGLNIPVVKAGVHYKIKRPLNKATDSLSDTLSKKLRIHMRLALGMNESGSSTTPVNGPKYPVYLTSVYVTRLYSPVNKVTLGIEGWYNTGVHDFIVSQEFYHSRQWERSCSVALVIGHEFLLGHFSLVTNGGIYLYNPFYKERLRRNEIDGFKSKLKSYVPARLGVQYYLKEPAGNSHKNLFLGIYIKTNFGQADFLESGIGFVF